MGLVGGAGTGWGSTAGPGTSSVSDRGQSVVLCVGLSFPMSDAVRCQNCSAGSLAKLAADLLRRGSEVPGAQQWLGTVPSCSPDFVSFFLHHHYYYYFGFLQSASQAGLSWSLGGPGCGCRAVLGLGLWGPGGGCGPALASRLRPLPQAASAILSQTRLWTQASAGGSCRLAAALCLTEQTPPSLGPPCVTHCSPGPQPPPSWQQSRRVVVQKPRGPVCESR